MEDTVLKAGFLQKACKNKYQAWRKRWFVLNGYCLRYYECQKAPNEDNFPRQIPLSEVLSVIQSKDKINAFIMQTRTRSYHLSAESELERNEWISVIQGSAANHENLAGAPYNAYGDIVRKTGTYDIRRARKSSPKVLVKSKSNFYIEKTIDLMPQLENCERSSEVPGIGIDSDNEAEIPKSAAADDNVSKVYSDEPKRVVHLRRFPQKHHILSLLHEISSSDDEEAFLNLNETLIQNRKRIRNRKVTQCTDNRKGVYVMEDLYKEIDKVLDGVHDPDEDMGESDDQLDEKDAKDSARTHIDFILPPPRDNEERYAFDEIKELMEKSEENDLSDDLNEIAGLCNLKLDITVEYPAALLLSQFIETIS